MKPEKVYSNRRVCHQHFENIYFSEGCKRLHTNAIPTLKLSGNGINLISNHMINPGETEKEDKIELVISQDHSYARSTRCMEQENYRDYAESMFHAPLFPFIELKKVIFRCGSVK
ncbi:uncharacterized protein [Diabrotica undecimpunctata]|uniref:uncharacterized protein n=1 Tax=Diabrotica undecimpunctata TaxID=50387 RepID=UPI003B635D55